MLALDNWCSFRLHPRTANQDGHFSNIPRWLECTAKFEEQCSEQLCFIIIISGLRRSPSQWSLNSYTLNKCSSNSYSLYKACLGHSCSFDRQNTSGMFRHFRFFPRLPHVIYFVPLFLACIYTHTNTQNHSHFAFVKFINFRESMDFHWHRGQSQENIHDFFACCYLFFSGSNPPQKLWPWKVEPSPWPTAYFLVEIALAV